MIDGEVISINQLVQDNVGVVNDDAEKNGWLIQVKLRDLN